MLGYGGECQSYGTSTSYLVWQSIWRAFFNLDPTCSLDEQIESLERQLSEIDPALISRLPLLGAVFNLQIPDNDLTSSFDAKLRKESLESLLVDCVRKRARSMPLLFVLEDCHWLDPLSHDLLEVIGRSIVDLPVLIVVAYRPPQLERSMAPHVSKLFHFTEIMLKDLPAEEIEQLVSFKLGQIYGEQARLPASAHRKDQPPGGRQPVLYRGIAQLLARSKYRSAATRSARTNRSARQSLQPDPQPHRPAH